MDGFHLFSYFQVLQSLLWFFGDCTKNTNYYWYKRHFHVPCFFQFPSKGQGTYPSFYFLSILLCCQPGQQSPQFCKFSFLFFLLFIIKSGCLAEIRRSVCMSKSNRSLCVPFSRKDAGLYIYHLFIWSNLNFFAQFPVDHLANPIMPSLILFLC